MTTSSDLRYIPEPVLIEEPAPTPPTTELNGTDRERLTWLATVGQADAEQLALRFGGNSNWIRQRMRRREAEGLVLRVPTPEVRRNGVAYRVTDSACRQLGPSQLAPPADRRADAIATWSLVTLRAQAERDGRTVEVRTAPPPDLVLTSPAGRRTLVHLPIGNLTSGRIATLLETGLDDEDLPEALVLVADAQVRDRLLADAMVKEWGGRLEVRLVSTLCAQWSLREPGSHRAKS